MIKAIEMNSDDLKELMDHLPEKLRKKFRELIKPDAEIQRVKNFVDQYDDDYMIDHIIAHTVGNLIGKIGKIATDMTKEWKKKGKHFGTIDMGMLVIECLKDEAKNIQNALDSHEKECKKGDDCGAKH